MGTSLPATRLVSQHSSASHLPRVRHNELCLWSEDGSEDTNGKHATNANTWLVTALRHDAPALCRHLLDVPRHLRNRAIFSHCLPTRQFDLFRARLDRYAMTLQKGARLRLCRGTPLLPTFTTVGMRNRTPES